MQTPSSFESTNFSDKTELSDNFITQNKELIQFSNELASQQGHISTDVLLKLPTYPICVPFSTTSVDTNTTDCRHCIDAITTALQYSDENQNKQLLPNITNDTWDPENNEYFFTLFPKYILSNSIVILSAINELLNKLSRDVQKNQALLDRLKKSKDELIETVRLLETMCIKMEKKGQKIAAFIRLWNRIKFELEQMEKDDESETRITKEEELKAAKKQIQKMIGQYGDITLTGSYADQLATIRPLLKKIYKYYEDYPFDVDQQISTFLSSLKAGETPDSQDKINNIKKITISGILIVLGALTGATVTAICYEDCNTIQTDNNSFAK